MINKNFVVIYEDFFADMINIQNNVSKMYWILTIYVDLSCA